jgi:hypothetical protein
MILTVNEWSCNQISTIPQIPSYPLAYRDVPRVQQAVEHNYREYRTFKLLKVRERRFMQHEKLPSFSKFFSWQWAWLLEMLTYGAV